MNIKILFLTALCSTVASAQAFPYHGAAKSQHSAAASSHSTSANSRNNSKSYAHHLAAIHQSAETRARDLSQRGIAITSGEQHELNVLNSLESGITGSQFDISYIDKYYADSEAQKIYAQSLYFRDRETRIKRNYLFGGLVTGAVITAAALKLMSKFSSNKPK